MPTVKMIGPYPFFFYLGDRGEPPHIHVERDSNIAKFWLQPIQGHDFFPFNWSFFEVSPWSAPAKPAAAWALKISDGRSRGIPATGSRINVPSITIVRMAQGQFAERWNLVDHYGILQQLPEST